MFGVNRFTGANVYVPYQGAGSAGRASSGTSRGRPRRRAAARGAGSAEKTVRVTAENSTVARGPSPYSAERTTRGSSTKKRVTYSLTLYSTYGLFTPAVFYECGSISTLITLFY